mgnify:CR=1 FL=1
MNDATSGQLTNTWQIPAYAQGMLHIDSGTGLTLAEGPTGLFELDAPSEVVTLWWGSVGGSALTQLRWQADNLEWDGRVCIGGGIDAVHIMTLPGLEGALSVLHVDGQPLRPEFNPVPLASQRRLLPYPLPDFLEAIDEDVEPSNTTWLVAEDSPLSAIAQDAMMNNLHIALQGHLADETQGLHTHFALPIVLDAITLFAR